LPIRESKASSRQTLSGCEGQMTMNNLTERAEVSIALMKTILRSAQLLGILFDSPFIPFDEDRTALRSVALHCILFKLF
jgi:hypothetical protein